MGVGSVCEVVVWLIECERADQRWSRGVGSSVVGGRGAGAVVTSGCSQSVGVDEDPTGGWVVFVVWVEAGMCAGIEG